MNIWRINCKPGEQILTQKDQFDFWLENGFIGIGWSSAEGFDKGFIKNSNSKNQVKDIKDYIFQMYRKEGWKTQSFSTASNIFVDRMKIDDFIWVRCGNTYKLGKIVSECLYNFNSKIFKGNHQIGFYRKVEYLDRDFSESEVPGKIVASYRTRSTVQIVYDYKDMIATYCEACFTEKNIKISINNWNYFLHSDDIEEVIGLYLQIAKKLYVYTSTNKSSTAEIEFELVDINGNHFGVQVKSGETSLDAKNFEEISKRMKVYLFAANNDVKNIDTNNINIEKIEVSDVTDFLKKYLNILPGRIKYWFV